MIGNYWWGYLHSNETIQCKRWFGDRADYTTDCQDNPFVLSVVEPFEAVDRQAADIHLRKAFEQKGFTPK